jgi:phosphotransacetylase
MVDDIDIMKAVKKSKNISECLNRLYGKKNHSGYTYKRVLRLINKHDLKFK